MVPPSGPKRAGGYLTNLASGSDTSIDTCEYCLDGYKRTGAAAVFGTGHEKTLAPHSAWPIVDERGNALSELIHTNTNLFGSIRADAAAEMDTVSGMDYGDNLSATVGVRHCSRKPLAGFNTVRYYWDQQDD